MSVTFDMALEKLKRYCAYQERCHQEVRSKLFDLGVYGDVIDQVTATLIEENFLNEERFAKIYAGSKFRQKSWGRLKITQELKKRNISPYCLRKGLAEIDDEAYEATLKTELLRKYRHYAKSKNDYERKQKTVKSLISKGFESHLVWQLINTWLFEHLEEE